jgi:uncharacterized membrane protein YsdA (DUF1294 family)
MVFADFLPSQILWTLIWAALAGAVIMSLLAYAAFAHDKTQAQSGGWRVPEATLLYLAVFGGWFGAKIAQREYRHKTRKEPFRTLLNLVGGLHAVLIATLLFMPGQRVGESLNEIIAEMIRQGGQTTTAENAMPRRFGPGSSE